MLKYYDVFGQLSIDGHTYPAVRLGYSLEEEILKPKRRSKHLNWADIEAGKIHKITKHLFRYIEGRELTGPMIQIFGVPTYIYKREYPILDVVISVWLEENKSISSNICSDITIDALNVGDVFLDAESKAYMKIQNRIILDGDESTGAFEFKNVNAFCITDCQLVNISNDISLSRVDSRLEIMK